MGGAIAFGIGICRNSLADGLDGVEIGWPKSGMDGGADSSLDGGALCVGASDHFGYESDLLGDGGAGLFGRCSDRSSGKRIWISFFPLHGVGFFGERADGVGGSIVGGNSLDLGCQEIGEEFDFTLEERGSFDFGSGDELVCGGVFEISRIVELFFGVRVSRAFCQHDARSFEALVVLSSNSGDRDCAVDRIFAGTG